MTMRFVTESAPGDADAAEPLALRVLLIEDDPDDGFLILEELRRDLGLDDVDHVQSLAAAEVRLAEGSYDAVLLDLGLPDANGLETYERIKLIDHSTPVVILSGTHDADLARAAIRSGAQDFIPKSAANTGLLKRVIQHAIERAEANELRVAQSTLFEALLANTLDSVYVLDAQGAVIHVQRSAGDDEEGTPVGARVEDLVHADDRARWLGAFHRVIQGGVDTRTDITLQMLRPRGLRWIELRMTNLLRHPAVRGVVINGRDITERRNFEQRLEHQAMHDALTGLPNRTLMRDRIDVALARGQRHETTSAVFFLDLDRFKTVNDTSGHDGGDQLLIAVSRRLSAAMRSSDTVARYGGDEFVILADEIDGVDDVDALAARIEASFSAPFVLGDQKIFCTASIGVSIAQHGDKTSETMLSEADAAMYQAKRAGRACTEIFDQDLKQQLQLQRMLEQELHEAIDGEQLRAYFQPVIDVTTGTIRACEALIRWEHPHRGLLEPADFMHAAEDSGLVVGIDRWILARACEAAVRWQQTFSVRLDIASNVSAATIVDPGWLAFVEQTLRGTGLAPNRLHLEITETGLLQHPELAAASVKALRALGVSVLLDDFGTGYSSLAHLQRLSLSGIKIDRSFVAGLGVRASDTIIVRSTINLAHDLDLMVTAEGVESVDQLAILDTYGCDLVQGYFLDAPQPAEKLEERFRDSDQRTMVWRSLLDDVGYDRAWR
jgi:diguanylate cyclase (GGDEF)-like protein/PAS domain S-box-containing protein